MLFIIGLLVYFGFFSQEQETKENIIATENILYYTEVDIDKIEETTPAFESFNFENVFSYGWQDVSISVLSDFDTMDMRLVFFYRKMAWI
jgi:hypothetical protein